MACMGFPGDEDPNSGSDDSFCPECGGCLTTGKGKASCNDCDWGFEADPPEPDFDNYSGFCPY